MLDQLIDHLTSSAEYPLRSSSHISSQRGQKAARRKSDRIKCKKGRNPKSRGEVRDRLPIAQERENRARHDHTKQRQPPESCRRRQQQRRADKLQSTADDVKTVGKAPAREVGLYRTSPYNINDAGTNITAKAAVRIVGASDVSFTSSMYLSLHTPTARLHGRRYGFFANSINQSTAIR